MKTRSRKSKGSTYERKTVDFFNSLPNWSARKQPGSGIYSHFPHDVFATLQGGNDEHTFVVECKKWKNGWRTGDKAIGQADFLFIERDYGESMVYMKASTFAALPWDQILERKDDET